MQVVHLTSFETDYTRRIEILLDQKQTNKNTPYLNQITIDHNPVTITLSAIILLSPHFTL